MLNKKDQSNIKKAKEQIKAQLKETEKLNLGLDADQSSEKKPLKHSKFDAFLNPDEPSSLEGK